MRARILRTGQALVVLALLDLAIFYLSDYLLGVRASRLAVFFIGSSVIGLAVAALWEPKASWPSLAGILVAAGVYFWVIRPLLGRTRPLNGFDDLLLLLLPGLLLMAGFGLGWVVYALVGRASDPLK